MLIGNYRVQAEQNELKMVQRHKSTEVNIYVCVYIRSMHIKIHAL